MTAAERRRLLGERVIEHIHEQVAAAPEPGPDVIADLRRILTNPAQAVTAEAVEVSAPSHRAA
jgi:hypothetical protein